MRLQSLSIKGFKSFADELTFDLKHPITGIIGPNGCGKSNLVDALRWVLGEQRPMWLRSEHMRDLIFNGSKHRKAMHMAEVSLLLDNTKHALSTDYAQITLSRRLYRHGENEYALNGVRSRRKDLTSLLLDSGLHADAYSIIELKMIDKLLHNTDDTRRMLFEQAAGIASFKARKKETLARLADTAQHMERLEDLLHEIKHNLQGLEKQAQQAKKYSSLKEAYKNLRCFLNEVQLAALQAQETRLQTQLLAEQDRQTRHAQAQIQTSTLLEKQKLHSLEKEKRCQTLQKAIHAQDTRMQESAHALAREEERLRTMGQQRQTFEDTHRRYLAKKAESHSHLKTLSSQKEEETTKKAVLQQKLQTSLRAQEEATQAYEASHRQRQAQEATMHAAHTRMHQAQNSVELAKARATWLDTQRQEQAQAYAQQQHEATTYQSACQSLEKTLKKQQAELDTHSQAAQKALEAQAQAEQRQAQLEDAYRETTQALDRSRKEAQFLRAIDAELEGASEAIRFLRKHADWKVQAPLVMELVSCPAVYRAAVESYLEPYAYHYVVDTEAQAQAAMDLLREAQKGRAHFFVLSRLQDEDMPSPSPTAPGETGEPIYPLLTVPAPYEKLMRWLFAHVYLTEKPAGKHRRFTWIQKDGTSTYKPRILSGGSPPREESSHMGRRDRLEKLETQVRDLDKDLLRHKKRLDQQQAQVEQCRLQTAEREKEKEKATQTLQALEKKVVALKSQHAQAKEFLRISAEKQKSLALEAKTSQATMHACEAQSQQEEAHLKSEKKAVEALDKTCVRRRKDMQKHDGGVSNQQVQLHKQQNDIERLEAQIDFRKKQFREEQQALQAQDKTHAQLEQSIQALEKNIPEKKAQNAKHAVEKTRLDETLHKEEEAYYSAKGQVDVLEKEREAIMTQQENSKLLGTEMEGKHEQLLLERKHIEERQRVSFGADARCKAKDPAWEEMSTEVLEKKAQGLEGKLSRMGEVNMLAIKNYETLQERYAFLEKEKADVLSARASLEDTIRKIEETVQKQFTAAFEKTRVHFKELFGMVFGEGSACDVHVEDAKDAKDKKDAKDTKDKKDPLEGRIVIVAKPKGKHLRSIEQLSSGERTLTALCLLFAVYTYKPSPFCVLDEVDAPLDDVNIEKFNRLIKILSKKAQFLIITHNKLTMQHTEAIYGITMVEGGVSRVLPVDWDALVEQV